MTQTLNICAINIGERCRTDFGDISDLAESIKAIGLLHPVVVTANHDLIAGERRLAAMARLMWTEIPVTIVDIDNAADALRAELEENTCRRSLSAYEADVLREKRERVLAEDARRRQGLRSDLQPSPKLGEGCATGELPGMPGAPQPEVAMPTVGGGDRRTAKVAAIGTGYSGSTLDKVRTIRDAAERGVIKQGRSEIPAPEPVQRAAREVIEDVKKTGAAVERAVAAVNKAIEDHVPAPIKAREALTNWRTKFQGAISRIAKVFGEFAPEQAAENADEELISELRRTHADLGNYIERVEALRNNEAGGLRLVQGGER